MFSKRGKYRDNRNKNSKPYYKNNQKKVYRHCDQLTEIEVGISEYISQHEGFGGIIKARYSDFQVHEINLQGEVAKLTDTSVPKEFSMKMVKTDFKEVPQSPNENIPQEKWEEIKKVALTPNSEPVVLETNSVSKEIRKEIHDCIKSHFGKKVISSTISKDGKQCIEIRKYNKDIKSDTRVQWPSDMGEYVYFVVYKEKIDTMEACMKISNAFRMPPSKFTHAGTKDRRAVTTQWFSVHKVEPWKLLQKTRKIFNLRVGNFVFKNEPLRLGQLQGNNFNIALRNITAKDEDISRSVDNLRKSGFINYFGLQRFGNDKEVPTFLIGVRLLQGKWKEAVQLILKPKASDDPESFQSDVVNAKKIYSETGDAAKAYREAQRNKTSSVEFKLLEGLTKNNDNDYVNALENVPRSMRLLYLHSFQSLIWNKMVSKRLQLFGMKPVEGDLVFMDQPTDKQEEPVVSETPEKCDDDNEHEEKSVMETIQDDEGTHSEELEVEANEDFKCKKNIKVLTSDDLPNYTIYDIILPLPGYDIVYPEKLKQYYKEALEEHELTLEMTKQKVRSYNLCGDYRKILERVEDLSWKTMKYDNPTGDLIRSDLQELKREPEPVSVEGGKYKALILQFSLSSSSYATMVLREIMKCDTSSYTHSQMNDYDEKNVEKKDEKKKSKIVIDNVVDNEDILMPLTSGLLSNREKYEEFKNSIFNNSGESLKRTNTDTEVEDKSKKLKKDDNDGIITQASLI